jgi:hypothetical protein
MDEYEISEVKGPPGGKRPAGSTWNVLAVVAGLLTILIIVALVIIYINPQSALNPFPPPTTNALAATTTKTDEPVMTQGPTWTPTMVIFQPSETPEPTEAPVLIPTYIEDATSTPMNIPLATDDYSFVLRQGNPAAIDGAQFHPDAGCKWLGVAGQATSLNGESVRGLFVHLGGTLDGKIMDVLAMTGLAPQYGAGGFEITLADQLISSNTTLWVQLMDAQNLPLSRRVYFSTFNDCTKNLVIIYFDQVR